MSSLFDLTGKVAIVTGSTKGIGLAIATRMAEHGATVVISSRKPDACEAVAAGIRDEGRQGGGHPLPYRAQGGACRTWWIRRSRAAAASTSWSRMPG